MYILDTNILIYYLQGNAKVIEFLDALCQEKFYISIVTRLELLIGASKESQSLDSLEEILDQCVNISMDKKIVKEALKIKGNAMKSLKFKDLIIAATALTSQKTLITSDKDFQKIKGLDILFFTSKH